MADLFYPDGSPLIEPQRETRIRRKRKFARKRGMKITHRTVDLEEPQNHFAFEGILTAPPKDNREKLGGILFTLGHRVRVVGDERGKQVRISCIAEGALADAIMSCPWDEAKLYLAEGRMRYAVRSFRTYFFVERLTEIPLEGRNSLPGIEEALRGLL